MLFGLSLNLIVGVGYLAVAILTMLAARVFTAVLGEGRVAGRTYDEVRARVRLWWLASALLLLTGLFTLLGGEAKLAQAFGSIVSVGIEKAELAEHSQQQLVYVVGWLLMTLPVSLGLLIAFRGAGERALFALAMVLALAILVGVRACAYPDITAVLVGGFHGVSIGTGIEIVGLVAIAIAADGKPNSSWISPKPRSPKRPRYRRR
jgi:predicted CDP-diglyceride synthetase/phosphatidate cytidylyltransferase